MGENDILEFGKWERGENDDGSDAINDLFGCVYSGHFRSKFPLKPNWGLVTT